MAAVLPALAAPEKAARLWGAAEALHETFGVPLTPTERKNYTRYMGQVFVTLGENAAAVWAEGSALTWEHAAVYVLEEASGESQARRRPGQLDNPRQTVK